MRTRVYNLNVFAWNTAHTRLRSRLRWGPNMQPGKHLLLKQTRLELTTVSFSFSPFLPHAHYKFDIWSTKVDFGWEYRISRLLSRDSLLAQTALLCPTCVAIVRGSQVGTTTTITYLCVCDEKQTQQLITSLIIMFSRMLRVWGNVLQTVQGKVNSDESHL